MSRINAIKRRLRIKEARLLGTHTKDDWEEMKLFFNYTCVKCNGKSNLINVEKDHIIPIYQGGSDGLSNIQPMCAKCNSSKGVECIDWRYTAAKILNKELPKQYTQNV